MAADGTASPTLSATTTRQQSKEHVPIASTAAAAPRAGGGAEATISGVTMHFDTRNLRLQARPAPKSARQGQETGRYRWSSAPEAAADAAAGADSQTVDATDSA